MERCEGTVEGVVNMKVVLLAGGLGTRLSEETQSRPKPMVEIGEYPVLWHIMKIYSSFNFNEFVICCGYKGQIIKDYFLHYNRYRQTTNYRMDQKQIETYSEDIEPWTITMANTGLKTLTAGRILKIKEYIGDDEEFMLTYGDGVGDIDIDKLLEFHHSHGKLATISVVKPAGRFGAIKIDENSGEILNFKEKARKDQSWVNIGYMVFNRKVFDYLGDGSEMLEASPFEKLAADGQMMAYRHEGFWSPMDTVHDRKYLEELWNGEEAPWKLWE